jgi:hypothetical protein
MVPITGASGQNQARGQAQIRRAGPVAIDRQTQRPKVHDKNWLKSQAQKRYGKTNILNQPVPKSPAVKEEKKQRPES